MAMIAQRTFSVRRAVRPSKPYIRYSDDGGKTFTAESRQATDKAPSLDAQFGHNLLAGSWSYDGWTVRTDWKKEGNGIISKKSTMKNWHNLDSPLLPFSAIEGKTVTLSLQVKGTAGYLLVAPTLCYDNGARAFQMEMHGEDKLTPDTWLDMHMTFVADRYKFGKIANSGVESPEGFGMFRVIVYRYLVGELYLRNMKLEIGDHATPWTPAPEDTTFGTTPGRYMGVAFSDKGYPPMDVADYDWSETKGRGVSSVTRYFALSNSGTVAPSGGYDANPKTPTATARYLWVYDKTTYDTGETVVGTPYVLSVHGQDGTNGKDALTINVKPQTIIVDTDADGHVTANQLAAATATIEAWVGGVKTTPGVTITSRSAGIGAVVSGPTVAVSAIADDPTTRMAYGSGWVDVTVTADGKAVPVRIPVATNIHKVVTKLNADTKSVVASVSSMKQEAVTEAETRATNLAQAASADAKRYAKQYTDAAIEITEGKIAQTVSKEAYDANNTRIESRFTQVLQTASEYSITVGQEAAGRNLLEGGWIDVTGWQYGVLNALNMLPHVSLKAGHTYTLTVCAANTARPSVYHVRAHIFDAEWRDYAGITIMEAEDTIRSVTFTAKHSDIYFVDFYPQDNEGKPAAAQGRNIRVQWATLVEGRVGKAAWQPSEQDDLNSGINIKRGTIDMVADRFTLRNNQGETTMGVDEDGNFMVQGVVKADTLLRKYAETRTGMSAPGQDVFGIELQELNGKISPVKYMPPDILVVVTPSGASPFLRLPWAGHCVGRVLDIYGENYNVMSAATYAPTIVTAQGNDAYINGGGAGSDVGPEPIYSDYENQCFQLVGSHSCQTITMNTWNNVAGQAHLRLIAADVGGAAGAPNYRWVVLNMTNCRPNT